MSRPPGETQQHLALAAHCLAHLINAVLDNAGRIPKCLAATDFKQEALQDATALAGVCHLGVKLDTVESTGFIRHAGQWRIGGLGNHREAFRQRLHPVAVAHPDIQQPVTFLRGVILDIPQQLRVPPGPHLGVAVFVGIGTGYLATQLRRHGLHAVADTQYRHPEFKHQARGTRGILARNRLWPPRRMIPAGFCSRMASSQLS